MLRSREAVNRGCTVNVEVTGDGHIASEISVTSHVERLTHRGSTIDVYISIEISIAVNTHRRLEVSMLRSREAVNRSCTIHIQVQIDVHIVVEVSLSINVQRVVQRRSSVNVQRVVQRRSSVNVHCRLEVSIAVHIHRSVEVSVL